MKPGFAGIPLPVDRRSQCWQHPEVVERRATLMVAGALLAALGIVPCDLAAQTRPGPPLDCLRFTQQARRLTCDAANHGDVKSIVLIGTYFASGNGILIDYETAVRLFRLAADQGDAVGEAYLGSMYASGCGVAENDAEAVRLLRSAADKGNAMAQVDLADLYVTGKGVAKSNAEAIRLYRLAADQGNVDGMNGLAWRLVTDGKNLDEALDWAMRAAARNPQGGDIQDTLGWILYRQDKAKLALPHAVRAVALVPGCASCEDHLGDIYAAAGDRNKARVHWRRALELSAGRPTDPDWDGAAIAQKLAKP
jgi:TPR repeat protein